MLWFIKLKTSYTHINYYVYCYFVSYWPSPMAMDAVLATIVASGWAQLKTHRVQYINKMILLKSFDSSLQNKICKAAHPSGSVESWNPCYLRGKWLHHHGGDVCCVFVLCVLVSSGHCHLKYVRNYQNITLRYAYRRTIRFIGVTY